MQLCLCMGHVGLSIWMEDDCIENKTEIVDVTVIVDTSTPNESHTIPENRSQICSLPNENWKIPTAITISTAASSISFLLMTLLILIPVYSYIRKCSCCNNPSIFCRVCCNSLYKVLKKGKVISPFEDNKNTSTALTRDQSLCFFFNYFLAVLLLYISFAFLVCFGWQEHVKRPCPMNVIHFISFVFRLVSQFSAIHSCFIFF